jgi:methionyl aminopeptidase
MAISYKTSEQIDRMRRAGRVVHEALQACRRVCEPGVTTAQINAAAEQVLEKHGATGLFLNYPHPGGLNAPFPAVTCISVNEELVHGVPGERVIEDGDIVSVDVGVKLDDWCGDSATTILVGNVDSNVRRLCEVTEHALDIAIANIRPGLTWSRIARMMEDYAARARLGIIRDYVGHGIGRDLHEEPKVPNFVTRELKRNDIPLEPGLVMAIEPMCTLGTERTRTLADHWTVVTADRKHAAHYEHTIAVTEDGCEVLTSGE